MRSSGGPSQVRGMIPSALHLGISQSVWQCQCRICGGRMYFLVMKYGISEHKVDVRLSVTTWLGFDAPAT